MTQRIFKRNIYQHIQQMLEKAELETTQLIQQTKESRNNESKSTAGDKHETSRATTQHEIDKYEAQLNKIQQQQMELKNCKSNEASTTIENGSLVITNFETFFVGIGLGKVKIDDFELFAISLGSPIGKLMKGLKIRDSFTIQKKKYEIVQIN